MQAVFIGDYMKIVTIGELLVDLTQTEERDGIVQYAANPGGAPANVAVAASLLGCETAFIGKVGNDSFGHMLTDTLKSKNVDVSGVVKSDEFKTTLAVVSLDGKGERSFSFYRKNCADVNLRKDEIDYNLIKNNPKILCGFSDITALANAIYAKTGLVTYSGPHYSSFGMKKGFEEYTLEYIKKMFFDDKEIKIDSSKEWSNDAWFIDQENREFIKRKIFKGGK